jgi:hypothetical protein
MHILGIESHNTLRIIINHDLGFFVEYQFFHTFTLLPPVIPGA